MCDASEAVSVWMGEGGGAILAATVRDLTSKMRTNPMKKIE